MPKNSSESPEQNGDDFPKEMGRSTKVLQPNVIAPPPCGIMNIFGKVDPQEYKGKCYIHKNMTFDKPPLDWFQLPDCMHEKQQQSLCGMHALHNLEGNPDNIFYTEDKLRDIAKHLDNEYKRIVGCRRIPPNASPTGLFERDVLSEALNRSGK